MKHSQSLTEGFHELPKGIVYLTGSLKAKLQSPQVYHVKFYVKNKQNKLEMFSEETLDVTSDYFKKLANMYFRQKVDNSIDNIIYISLSNQPSQTAPAVVYKENDLFFVAYKDRRSTKLKLMDMVSLLVGMGINISSDKIDDMLISALNWVPVELDKEKADKRSRYWPKSELDTTVRNESMNPVIKRIMEMRSFTTFQEASPDLLSNLDDRMIEYINQNLNDPTRKEGFLRAVKRFKKLMDNEPDPVEAMYYYYRMILPDKQARNMARDFYKSERNSNTGSDIAIGADGQEYYVADSVGYGNDYAGKGMFASLTGRTADPETLLEIDDFMTKLFNHKYMEEQDRILLATYLTLGTGPGLRAKGGSNRQGLDLESVMNNPPEALDTVMNQINKLIDFGIDPDSITGEKILQGASKNDGDDNQSVKVNPLLSTARVQVAQRNIKKALADLTGTEDLDEIWRMFNFTMNPKDFKAKRSSNEAADPKVVMNTILAYLDGEEVSSTDLIKAVVNCVAQNIKLKTKLSKSRYFGGSVKAIAKKYMDMAKAGGEKNVFRVQDLFMAPVLDKYISK